VCRIARGSGCAVADVNELLAQYRVFSQRTGKPRRGCPAPPKVASLSSQLLLQTLDHILTRTRCTRAHSQGQNVKQLANLLPPGMMNQMGGIQGIQEMMKSMGSGGWPQGS
jgi:signal recognition particle subunit SRP54